jgi:hypothetical protein
MSDEFKPKAGSIAGTPVILGGKEFIMPPMNLDQVKQFEAQVPELGKQGSLVKNIEHALPMVLAALQRNYPGMTKADLGVLIDLGNFEAVTKALVTSSGFQRAQPGEATPAAR